jgi:23S rRNA pseudouridine1911/1915/1917 synthase
MGTGDFKTFHVTADVPRRTLATALRFWNPECSWSHVKKWISSRCIQVNGNLCMDESRPLTLQDVVRVWNHPLAKPPSLDDVRILHLDDYLVIVEKPSGMTTLRHSEEQDWPRHRRDRQPTLDEVLPRVLNARQRQNEPRTKGGTHASNSRRSKSRVRAVHRLDRETSGVMVFARSIPVERSLVEMFKQHALHRAYVAIVHGEVQPGTIRSRLVRDRGDGRRGVTDNPNEGQSAVTHVEVLETFSGYSVVKCRLETGRTHQIRIHLASRGNLVCGEKVYDKQLGRPPMTESSGAPRLALHAAELGFKHPVTGKALEFKSPLPDDLQIFLNRLRRKKGRS